jgi:hypothetical protein
MLGKCSGNMQKLTKDQAVRISELTSTVFQQGPSWVFQEMDLDTGVQRLTRGLTEKAAKKKLKSWRREKVEQLLRSTPDAEAYTLKTWHTSPSWNGEGVWHWAQNFWYTTREEAEEACEKINEKGEFRCEVFQTVTEKVPGHFIVA